MTVAPLDRTPTLDRLGSLEPTLCSAVAALEVRGLSYLLVGSSTSTSPSLAAASS